MEHRIKQTDLHLQMFFFYFTTSIQNWTDKSMKVILFTKTSAEGEGGAGQACCAGFTSVMKMVMMTT